MIFKTLLGLTKGAEASVAKRKSGLLLAKQVTLEFNEKQGGFLFDGKTGKSWTINPSGALILQGLIDGDPAQSIAEKLRERFQVTSSRAITDISDFRSTLLREGHLSNHE
ncbi:MAG: PqqD family protein [Planctomycetota bacterium]|nr:PqqD family protein [Planctomycetota bacterium]